MEETAVNFLSQLSGFYPWLIGGIIAIAITRFLLRLGTWEITVPWQIRAFSRLFIVMVFVYLLLTSGALLVPEIGGKLTVFTDNIALVGDLLKTVVGAIIGALSMAIKAPHMDGSNNDDENDSLNHA